jgi:predicted glycosyltransferase
MLWKVFGTIPILFKYGRMMRKFNPDVIVSKASFYAVLLARVQGRKSVIFPDSEVVKVTNKYVVPLATKVITPETFGLDYGKKHIRIKGFFEDCYLSPNVFTPDETVLEKYGIQRPYALFRFVGWFANHDVGNEGFTLNQKVQLVKEVEKYMKVYVSSEKVLPNELRHCQLPAPASQIHHVLAFADLYLGDSQTMATESALLGTPAIRSNSFVGANDMTNFIVLENKYGLLKNIPLFEEVKRTAIDYAEHSRKEEWMVKRKEYYAIIGDFNQQIVSILEN